MMFITLSDRIGSVEVVVVPAVLTEFRELIEPDSILTITGRVDQKGEGETKLVAQKMAGLHVDPSAEEERLRLNIDAASASADHLDQLRRLITDHRGDAPVVLDVVTPEGPRRLVLGDDYTVDPRATSLKASLKSLFGERCIAS